MRHARGGQPLFSDEKSALTTDASPSIAATVGEASCFSGSWSLVPERGRRHYTMVR
jgi:hypothetical protein